MFFLGISFKTHFLSSSFCFLTLLSLTVMNSFRTSHYSHISTCSSLAVLLIKSTIVWVMKLCPRQRNPPTHLSMSLMAEISYDKYILNLFQFFLSVLSVIYFHNDTTFITSFIFTQLFSTMLPSG